MPDPTARVDPACEEADPRALLDEGARALGLALTASQLDAFDRYADLLARGRKAFNLTALTAPADVAIKHFLDSLTVLLALPSGPLRLIDVGSGAGFPGLPVKIARPEIAVTLVEATAKKASWLRQTGEALGLRDVQVLAARAEDVGQDAQHRGHYDAVTARAVAPLAVLCELCLPLLRIGGVFVAQKTAIGIDNELPTARRAVALLGATLREVRFPDLPRLPNRALAVFEQVAPAPTLYPRRAGLPAKRPLS